MQYLYDVDKLKAGIEEINPAMPPRGNAWVVEDDRVLTQCRKDFTE